jgi:histidinol-phosphate aminotransferase
MHAIHPLSRRGFMGGLAAALGYLGLTPGSALAQGGGRRAITPDQYDAFAKLANNENNWGPPETVMKAMTNAWKYANRYGYPDGNLVEEIAAHHGVKPDHILLGAGSGEILDVSALAFLEGGKKVVSVEPTFAQVFQRASSIKADAIKLPLDKDYRQNMADLITATKQNYRDVGFVYLCNPNNPTGIVVTKQEVKQLLDGIPEDVPVLIDEAYHHFVEDPNYATAVPYVIEGRPVIIARTFSKISALAGMRLGYAVAPPALIQRMRPYAMNSINSLVKHGGVASLKDTAGQEAIRRRVVTLRNSVTRELEGHGYPSLPSQANFFMVSLGREVQPVIEEFRKKNILVGRPFPPMTQHLRVSVGVPEEMDRFMVAFKKVMAANTTTAAAKQ